MVTNRIGYILLLVLAFGCAHPPYKNGRPLIGTLQTIGSYVRMNGKPAKNHDPVYSGDRIVTGANSSAYLHFQQGGFVQLDENTDPEFNKIWEGAQCFILMVGQLVGISYYESDDGECVLQFRNPTADAVRHGTRVYFKVEKDLTTVITVLEGTMVLTKPRNESIRAGWQAEISRKGEVQTRPLSNSELIQIEKWRTKYRLPRDFFGRIFFPRARIPPPPIQTGPRNTTLGGQRR